MLDSSLKKQLQTFFKDLEAQYVFDVTVSPTHTQYAQLKELLSDVCECSPNISLRITEGTGLQFSLLKNEEDTRIKFRCTPNGHEFSSLILAILNCDGKGKNFPSETITKRIQQLKGPIQLITYINLSCLACSEIVQSLNVVTSLNNQITHEIVDGGINKLEVIEKHIMALPTVLADGSSFLIGRATYPDIIDKLEAKYGTNS